MVKKDLVLGAKIPCVNGHEAHVSLEAEVYLSDDFANVEHSRFYGLQAGCWKCNDDICVPAGTQFEGWGAGENNTRKVTYSMHTVDENVVKNWMSNG